MLHVDESPGIERAHAVAAGRQNDIFMENVRNRAHSIDPAYWNVRWMGVADPRVRVTNTNTKGIDGLTDLWFQTKYTSEASAIRLASYTEAQGKEVMKPAGIAVRITLGRGIESATAWTCDFSYDYVKINADYRS
jgi:hypothetical protein